MSDAYGVELRRAEYRTEEHASIAVAQVAFNSAGQMTECVIKLDNSPPMAFRDREHLVDAARNLRKLADTLWPTDLPAEEAQ